GGDLGPARDVGHRPHGAEMIGPDVFGQVFTGRELAGRLRTAGLLDAGLRRWRHPPGDEDVGPTVAGVVTEVFGHHEALRAVVAVQTFGDAVTAGAVFPK